MYTEGYIRKYSEEVDEYTCTMKGKMKTDECVYLKNRLVGTNSRFPPPPGDLANDNYAS
jgi:hypothetical protein